MQEYAADGLRTLVLAYRDLSEQQWEDWAEQRRSAERAADYREDRLAAAYEEIEQDMMVPEPAPLTLLPSMLVYSSVTVRQWCVCVD